MGTVAKLGLGLGLLALVGVSLPLVDRVFGRQRLRFPYMTRALSSAEYQALSQQPGWSKSELSVEPGVTLRGLARRPQAEGAPWVLFYPGNSFTQLRTGQQFLTRLAEQRDWGLAVYAYRGFDASDGKPSHESLALDAPRVLERLCEAEHVPPARVHIMGFSIGGHFAVYAARGAALRHAPAASLTLLASVDDIVMLQNTPWQKLSAGDDYQTRPLLPEVPAPVLVLQGSRDEALAGAGQGRAIAEALGQRGEYRELEGVGHEALLSFEPALAAARQFVERNAK